MLFPNKKAIIVDVDGTLYNQKRLRIMIGFKLISYYFIHFRKIKELMGIILFRKYRYKDVYRTLSDDALAEVVSVKLHSAIYEIKDARHYWMNIYPLKYIDECKYRSFVKWLNNCNQIVYVYSDYPPLLKLDTLSLKYKTAYFPDGINIKSVKPDKESMLYILNDIGIPKEQILYIGDDDKKDGKSAKLAGIDYLNIKDVLKYA